PATVPALSEETREEMFTSGAARPNGGVIGHFGTYSPFITPLLVETIYRIAIRRCDTRFLLLGRGALNFREQLLTRFPELRGRVEAKEGLSAVSIAGWLRRCDILLQPYLDGISSRRTTVMAGLANGRAIVTNLGPLSEPLWSEGAVVAVARPDPQALAEQVIALLNDPASRAELAGRAAALYQSRFSLTHTLTRLRTLLCGAPDGC
ncbi:MAG: glycosyltransferase, partial [Gemmataceae bacterium]|nr:glycosyltransferase [Gemmataceae bacterium]